MQLMKRLHDDNNIFTLIHADKTTIATNKKHQRYLWHQREHLQHGTNLSDIIKAFR